MCKQYLFFNSAPSNLQSHFQSFVHYKIILDKAFFITFINNEQHSVTVTTRIWGVFEQQADSNWLISVPWKMVALLSGCLSKISFSRNWTKKPGLFSAEIAGEKANWCTTTASFSCSSIYCELVQCRDTSHDPTLPMGIMPSGTDTAEYILDQINLWVVYSNFHKFIRSAV